jgi:hypothetical protein
MRPDEVAGASLAGLRLGELICVSCTTELREHLSQPGTLTCLPTIWQAWGRKPAAS